MKSLVCQNCCAPELRMEKGYWVCNYCGSRFMVSNEELDFYSKTIGSSIGNSTVSSSICLSDDVEKLLQKCRTDRKNARKYANLILDIDPDNLEALQYL